MPSHFLNGNACAILIEFFMQPFTSKMDSWTAAPYSRGLPVGSEALPLDSESFQMVQDFIR